MIRNCLIIVQGVLLVCFVAACTRHENRPANKTSPAAGNEHPATITKLDTKNHSITLRMKDSEGKETERSFRLEGDVRYLDSAGKATSIDSFQPGNDVLAFTADGKLNELRQTKAGQLASNTGGKAGTITGADKEDQQFVKSAGTIDVAEIKLGKLAEQRASTEQVKKYAERLILDHTNMNKSLKKIATQENVTLPDQLDKKHQEMEEHLTTLKGPEFDKSFVKHMISGHEAAIKKFESEAKNGQDPEVKAWAEKWLPTLREHLELARDCAKDLK